ncbi:MAG TPA: glycoside hydrolase family 95 protein [Verrucomicrobiae bacterium]|nr:glycoside hydrolase family 95 protein [Verrucomicrobiae bacterium]
MKSLTLLVTGFCAVLLPLSLHAESTDPLTLWYREPAIGWTNALPIGNGRLGAMVFGGVEREHLQLNEDTLWGGGPYDPNNTNALAALPEVRKLIFDGKYDEASALVGEKMMATPLRQMPYETLGDLFLDFPTNGTVENYRRDLNLDTAVASVSYKIGDITFKREMFVSPVNQVIVIHLTADKPGQISFTTGLTTPQKATVKVENGDTLVMSGVNADANGIKGALKFQARVRILPKGGSAGLLTLMGAGNLVVNHADSVTLLIAAATSYRNYHDTSGQPEKITKKQIAAASRKSFNDLRAATIAAHQKLFRRVELNLGDSGEAANLPTDERIRNFDNGNDPQFAALYFQFARYLLICSSRPGTQPANLQGIWNNSMNPPWSSKYTININTEMNYWPADTANLGECVEPLTQLVLDIAQTGKRTAKIEYDAGGWVAHHNTDLWRATAPIDGPQYGMWPSGGAWLCNQLFDHYEFIGDKNYLKKIYPAMRGAAQFFLDTLVEEPTHHWLVTCPSMSPENTNPLAKHASITDGPTMDLEILRDLFTNCIVASEILGKDKHFAGQLAATRARLAPLQVGHAGQLQEWLQDIDMQAHDLHHRHVSHLYGLFPSDQIDFYNTPELAAAAKKSLEIRGDESTGWATAWRINLWARLHDGDHAYSILRFLLSPERTYPDMLDAHPPFQIDGNFGGASAMVEMLLQSRVDESDPEQPVYEIEFLPALPKAWPDGSVSGLRARGGFEVSENWKDGKLVSATIKSLEGNRCHLRYGQTVESIKTKKDQELFWDGQKKIEFIAPPQISP